MKYEIKGNTFPVVECYLSKGEQVLAESGAMVWMTPNMEMATSGGGVGKVFSKIISGERMFQNIYTANGDGMVAFGSSFPGNILAVEIGYGKEIIVQKGAFLASEMGIELSIHFNKKVGVGFFGGEGFIMQRVSGNGTVFIEVDGELEVYPLKAGEQLIVDSGNLVGMDSSVSIDIQTVKGVKNMFFGGEGLFNTVLTGPGNVYLQTMPISVVADAIRPYIPTITNNNNND